jgi:hypothetical protein
MKRPETRWLPFFHMQIKQPSGTKKPKGTFHHLIALICTVAGKPVQNTQISNFFNEINNLQRFQHLHHRLNIVINEALRKGTKSGL